MNGMIFTLVIFGLALILSIIHYFSHMISVFIEAYHYKVLSFSGGTLLAMIFLVLLPETIAIYAGEEIYLLILLGFTIFYLAEKFLYQHVRDKKQQLKELKELHMLGFFIDHFILGFVMVTLLEVSVVLGFLILLPIFLQTISSSLVMAHIHEQAKTHVSKVLLSTAPIFGSLTALILVVDESIHAYILAFTLGMMIFIVSRDILPKEDKGAPELFIAGLVIVIAIWSVLTFSVG